MLSTFFNECFGQSIRLSDLTKPLQSKQTLRYHSVLGLRVITHRKPEELSFGQRQIKKD